jgi:hypothetical protein
MTGSTCALCLHWLVTMINWGCNSNASIRLFPFLRHNYREKRYNLSRAAAAVGQAPATLRVLATVPREALLLSSSSMPLMTEKGKEGASIDVPSLSPSQGNADMHGHGSWIFSGEARWAAAGMAVGLAIALGIAAFGERRREAVGRGGSCWQSPRRRMGSPKRASNASV